MPADKQTKPNTSKPLTPALSSNFRNVKNPLTPRVIGSAQSSPTLSTRREPFVRSKSPGKQDQVTTPLNGNITPRSGTRQSRIGTESPSTPAPVSGANNGALWSEGSRKEVSKPGTGKIQGLGINTARPAVGAGTPIVTVHRRVSATKSVSDGDKGVSAKFFHANDAKSTISSPGLDGGPRLPPGRGHFFVGSPPLPSPESSQPSRGPTSARDYKDHDDKFLRANEIAQHAPPNRPTLPQVSTVRIGDTATISKGPSQAADSRPVQSSPPHSPDRIRRPVAAMPPSPRKIQLDPGSSPPAPSRSTIDRPKSATGSTASSAPSYQGGHRKSISSSSITSMPVRRMSGQQTQRPQPLDLRLAPSSSPRIGANSMLSADTLSPRSVSLASTNTVSASITSDTECSESYKSAIASINPADSGIDQAVPPLQLQNDRAADARRERKVLDLEISNSSLLAINKTLERELRKQSGELRRYRRLSRSGRLSLAASTRTVSGQSSHSLGTLTELDGESQSLSDLDPGSDLDDLDDEEDSLVSNDSSSLTSPTARSRQRARDERRLLLDLSKHHQLLLDSQKLSQSIKRCLTCTEELIRDGNRALDYKVGIGDVKLGGRVLHDEELDERGFDNGTEEPGERKGLLSPGLTKAKLDEAQLWVDHTSAAASKSEFTALTLLQEITEALESDVADS
ncbi:hypothetical protein A1O3_08739 [Capronia epimyces CBS 606.96]|uniref:Uncharacterized protein n=1 Tax=Capronia epimyces CBS 606.96 TaxID=1182542 RepID=W9XG64_9EURO|nr:uncharacterized protein A1O3_08739 [Capronia epimyces CBS 606.96]EXJ79238.1 hypothetical protein A1O3_08739 [Capronia epimyces CBS 606.96]